MAVEALVGHAESLAAASEHLAEATRAAWSTGSPEEALANKVRAGVLISGQRWNVVLDGGIELMLPADKPAAALATVQV